MACGILIPWPGVEPVPPALEGRVLNTGLPKKSKIFFYSIEVQLIYNIIFISGVRQSDSIFFTDHTPLKVIRGQWLTPHTAQSVLVVYPVYTQ